MFPLFDKVSRPPPEMFPLFDKVSRPPSEMFPLFDKVSRPPSEGLGQRPSPNSSRHR